MTTDLEERLRDTLAAEAHGLAVPADAWSRYAAREARHRRDRRVRRGALALAVAALVAVQTNVVALPGWVPAIPVAPFGTPLADGPARGALARDAAWFDGLRDRVEDRADPDGTWRVASRSAIRLIFAADVGAHRLALLLVPLRLGVVEAPELVWYEGPRGAAPARMQRSSNVSGDEPVAIWMDAGPAGGTAVVVGPARSAVRIDAGLTYGADGVVRYAHSATTGGGVGVYAIPPGRVEPMVRAAVSADGEVLYDGPVYGGWGGGEAEDFAALSARFADPLAAARGPGLDPSLFPRLVSLALHDARLPADTTSVRIPWTGRLDGEQAALFLLQPPGGGVIALAYHGAMDAGGGGHTTTDLRLLLPAEGADRRPLAWRMRERGNGDVTTERVAVVAPPGAVSATVTVTAQGGEAVPVTLDADGFGYASVPPDRPAVVTSTAADGSTTSTPVPLPEMSSGGPPGTTPQTRVVG